MDLGNQPTLPKKKTRLRKIFIWLGLLVLVVIIALLGYLYLIERADSQRLRDQLNQSPTVKEKVVNSPAIAPGQAKYAATVGKFTLTLPSQYYITVELDGGFEGGPATRLTVGTVSTKAEQTIISPAHARVSIGAYLIGDGNTYEARKKAELAEQEATKLTTVKVDGVDAEVYQLSGLFTDKKLFFTKNDIFYVITAGSVDSTTSPQKDLDEVVKGFKFN